VIAVKSLPESKTLRGKSRGKVARAASFIEATGDRRLHHGRPATLYRRGPARLLSPPLLRAPDHGTPAQVSAAASAPASYS
jgi:hypothetical protein